MTDFCISDNRIEPGDRVYIEYVGAASVLKRRYGIATRLWGHHNRYADVRFDGTRHTWPVIAAQLKLELEEDKDHD